MRSAEAQSLKGTLTAIFRRRGSDGSYTRLFDSLDSSQQSCLASRISLRAGEFPIIGSIPDANNWLLLTTERLAWHSAGEQREIAIDEIYDAIADLRKLQSEQKSKSKMQELKIVTMNRQEFLIELEPGGPLSGTWSALKNIGARNRSKAAT